jgi:C4-type Zn-finger protein
VSKIIQNAEQNVDNADVVCGNCPGHFQQVADNSTMGLFKRKFYQKWFWLCNQCGYKSKTYCSRVINNQVK